MAVTAYPLRRHENGWNSRDRRLDVVNPGSSPVPRIPASSAERSRPGSMTVARSTTSSSVPTGKAVDRIYGVDCTLIDNGMPCVIIRAGDLGRTGQETRDALDADEALKARLEMIRLQAGPMMALDDVAEKSVPKMILVSAPVAGGTVSTRSFIPHRCHSGIGVFAAVTVATACTLDGSWMPGLQADTRALTAPAAQSRTSWWGRRTKRSRPRWMSRSPM